MAVKGVKGLLVTPGNFDRCIEYLRPARRLVIDTETMGLEWQQRGIMTCGYAVLVPTRRMRSWRPMYFPFRHGSGNNLPERCLKKLVSVINGKTFTNWNTKFDLHMTRKDGVETPARAEDLMLSAHLLNENEFSFGLKELAVKYIDPTAANAQKALKLKLADMGFGKGDMWKAEADGELADYACDDVVLVELFRRQHIPALQEWSLYRIWREVNEYMLATTRMESHGLHLDMPLLEEYLEEATRMIAPSLAVVEKMAGYKINMNSNKQLQALLGMKSIAKEFLDPRIEEEPDNEVLQAVASYKKWNKVKSSYYEPYLRKARHTGVLHPNIKLHGTVAGRPSCEDPNLQAIPRKEKLRIYKVKDLFIAPPGYDMVQGDLSQAELRLFAHSAQDPVMMATLRDPNADIHQATADRMNVERDDAKRINFGIVYGLGAKGLAAKGGFTFKKANDQINSWHRIYRTIKPFYARMEARARHFGYIRLWTGRVRRYFTMRYPEERKALSNLIQGGVAEMMRHIILRIDRRTQDPNDIMYGTKMLLQVHDAIIFYIPKKRTKRVLPEIQKEMTRFDFDVPFRVDLSVGQRWMELEKWTPNNRKAA